MATTFRSRALQLADEFEDLSSQLEALSRGATTEGIGSPLGAQRRSRSLLAVSSKVAEIGASKLAAAPLPSVQAILLVIEPALRKAFEENWEQDVDENSADTADDPSRRVSKESEGVVDASDVTITPRRGRMQGRSSASSKRAGFYQPRNAAQLVHSSDAVTTTPESPSSLWQRSQGLDFHQPDFRLHPRLDPTATASLHGSKTLESHRRLTLMNITETIDEHVAPMARLKFTFDPTSKRRMWFDFVKFTALLYDLMITPYILAWEVGPNNAEMGLSLALLSLWLADIGVNFRTGFYNKGLLEMRSEKIAWQYLTTTFFLDAVLLLVDIVTIFIDTFLIQDESTFRNLKVARLARIIRLVKLIRIARMRHFSDMIMEYTHANQDGQIIFGLFRLLILLFWLNHILCCGWFFISMSGPSDTGQRWVNAETVDGGKTYVEASAQYQYFTALHWSLTQMTPASMQVSATNTWERIFSISAVTCGSLLFTFNVSMLSAKLTQRMLSTTKATDNRKTLERFLHECGINRSLTTQVKRQVTERLNYRPLVSPEEVLPILDKVAASLRKELQVSTVSPHFFQHDFFHLVNLIDNKAGEELCISTEILVLCMGDNLFESGYEAESAFLMVKGSVAYEHRPRISAHSVQDAPRYKSQVGTSKWLAELAMWLEWIHVGYAVADTHCMLLKLSTSKVIAALEKNLAVWDLARQYAAYFLWTLTEVHNKTRLVTDLLQLPELADAVQAFARSTRLYVGQFAIKMMQVAPRTTLKGQCNVQDLEAELLADKCSLSLAANMEILRLTSVVLLEVQRDDGRLLVEIGKFAEGQVHAVCRLPGSKHAPGEDPGAVLQRVVEQKLAPFDLQTDTASSHVCANVTKSHRYNLMTRYLQRVYTIEYAGDESNLHPHLLTKVEKQASRVSGGAGKSLLFGDVYGLEGPDATYLYAWLLPSELERYKAVSSLGRIQAMLQDLMEVEAHAKYTSSRRSHTASLLMYAKSSSMSRSMFGDSASSSSLGEGPRHVMPASKRGPSPTNEWREGVHQPSADVTAFSAGGDLAV
mmetsp:Transcript_42896/g.98412  ORF Transcript_42896/g.98412 Transcript_42896/m.98412 type:complete len:1047 (-) Transcript_42896:51-3191(-)